MLTTAQIRDRSKSVTRRIGWTFLNPGDELRAIVKGQGLKKGETVTEIARLRVTGVSREPLRMVMDLPGYGRDELVREGFPGLTPLKFVAMFVATHKGCTPATEVTRIEFEYAPAAPSIHSTRSLDQRGPDGETP